MCHLSKGIALPKDNDWALQTFIVRNIKYNSGHCPSTLFVTGSHEKLCYWFCKFITEACKGDGMEHMQQIIYLMLCVLQRHIKEVHPSEDDNLFLQPYFVL